MKNLTSTMKRRLDPLAINIPPEELILNFNIKIMSSGSCFAIVTAEHLGSLGISSYFNLKTCFRFSARSFADYFEYLNSNDPFKIENKLHSSGSGDNALIRSTVHAEVVENTKNKDHLINEIIKLDDEFIEQIKKSDIIIFTLGTAIYIKENSTGRVLGTHEGFERGNYSIVTPSAVELSSDIDSIVENICKIAKVNSKIFFTISPQRYSWQPIGDFRDGLKGTENSSSAIPYDGIVNNCYDKSRLRVTLQDVIERKSGKYNNIRYFPSYEIVLDELRHLENFGIRDGDFGHVSKDTSSHVINRFLNAYMSESMKNFTAEFKKIESDLNSRFSYKDVDEYAQKIKKIISIIADNQHIKPPSLYVNMIRTAIAKWKFKVHSDTQNSLESQLSDLYKNHYPKVGSVEEKVRNINEMDDQTPVYIFGIGETAELIMRISSIMRKNMKAFIQSSSPITPVYFGLPVVKYDEADIPDGSVIVIASQGSGDTILNLIRTSGIKPSQII